MRGNISNMKPNKYKKNAHIVICGELTTYYYVAIGNAQWMCNMKGTF